MFKYLTPAAIIAVITLNPLLAMDKEYKGQQSKSEENKNIPDSNHLLAQKNMMLDEAMDQFTGLKGGYPKDIKNIIAKNLYAVNKIEFSCPSIDRVEEEMKIGGQFLEGKETLIEFINSGVRYSGMIQNDMIIQPITEFVSSGISQIAGIIVCNYNNLEIKLKANPLDSDGNIVDLSKFNFDLVKNEEAPGMIGPSFIYSQPNGRGVSGVSYYVPGISANPQDVKIVLTPK